MKLTLRRIISFAFLFAALIAFVLILQKPVLLGHAQEPALIAQNAHSFDLKMAEFDQATQSGVLSGALEKVEIHLNADEVSAVIAQSIGTSSAPLTPNSNVGDGPPPIKDQQVSFEGDIVHGQFLTTIAGNDVWISISGHLGEKDGYATFDPTEFKVGDLNVPVSLVNPQLQKKLVEQRDRLKLPENVGSMTVENSELVMKQR